MSKEVTDFKYAMWYHWIWLWIVPSFTYIMGENRNNYRKAFGKYYWSSSKNLFRE